MTSGDKVRVHRTAAPVTGDLLHRLVAEARRETAGRRAAVSLERLEEAAASHSVRDFAAAIRKPGLSVIAEMKQRTPSMGVLVEDYRPADLALAYTRGGAAAISVLTHGAGFGGRPEHIRVAREHTPLPILRKDFITDAYQVVEAKAAGADAVLLVVAALDRRGLGELLREVERHGLTALVEVHSEPQTHAALQAGAKVIGVNHRDLRTFSIDLGLTEQLRKVIPPNVLVVAESGIRTREDARRMTEAGADAILVGEALMRADDPAERISELVGS